MARRKKANKRSRPRRKAGKGSRGDGRLRSFLWVLGAVVLAMTYVYIQNAGVVNKTALVEKKIAPALKTAGISRRDLAGEKVEKRIIEKKRYVHKEKVYKAPEETSFNKLDETLKKDLKKSGFTVARSGSAATKGAESYQASINYGTYNVMDLKVVKPKAVARAAPAPKPAPPPPVPARKPRKAKIAIVLDDFGYNMTNIPALAGIREPLTLSVLPGLPYSKEVARGGRERGYEVILHMPLESERSGVPEEADTIRSGMSAAAIDARIAKELQSVPGAAGVNNHQGSKGTTEPEVMRPVLVSLKKRGLFFLDSMTSSRSCCRDVADDVGIPFAKRDVFLDNSNREEDIEKQLMVLKSIALKKGRAIAIGHDRKNTIVVLKRVIPELKKEGVEVVPLSELVK